jgi:hypothetical protein
MIQGALIHALLLGEFSLSGKIHIEDNDLQPYIIAIQRKEIPCTDFARFGSLF